MNRVVRFHQTGGPEVLRLEEVPVPEPRPGEVLIRTRALGLNRAESMFRLGQYGIDPVFPSGIGYEAAGVVDALGDGVSGLRVGDAVSVVPSFTMGDYPMHGGRSSPPPTRSSPTPRACPSRKRPRCGCSSSPPTAAWSTSPGSATATPS
ncbi:alcohol dehydrogenase catalytic domain-containing protein [Streptomyces sp. M19]